MADRADGSDWADGPEQADGSDQDGAAPPPVDFGDEARKLISNVQTWAQRALPAPPSGHGGPECQWCPICQVASMLRGDHPEITERMVEAGTAVASALKSLLESATPGARTTPPEPTPAAEPTRPRPRPRPRSDDA